MTILARTELRHIYTAAGTCKCEPLAAEAAKAAKAAAGGRGEKNGLRAIDNVACVQHSTTSKQHVIAVHVSCQLADGCNPANTTNEVQEYGDGEHEKQHMCCSLAAISSTCLC